jgi:hypothetical protein
MGADANSMMNRIHLALEERERAPEIAVQRVTEMSTKVEVMVKVRKQGYFARTFHLSTLDQF